MCLLHTCFLDILFSLKVNNKRGGWAVTVGSLEFLNLQTVSFIPERFHAQLHFELIRTLF